MAYTAARYNPGTSMEINNIFRMREYDSNLILQQLEEYLLDVANTRKKIEQFPQNYKWEFDGNNFKIVEVKAKFFKYVI